MFDGLRAWMVAATSDPTSWSAGIIDQGPWAAAALGVSIAAAWLVRKFLDQLRDTIAQERKRAEAAEARAEKLEEYYREKVGPLLTEVARYLADTVRRGQG